MVGPVKTERRSGESTNDNCGDEQIPNEKRGSRRLPTKGGQGDRGKRENSECKERGSHIVGPNAGDPREANPFTGLRSDETDSEKAQPQKQVETEGEDSKHACHVALVSRSRRLAPAL